VGKGPADRERGARHAAAAVRLLRQAREAGDVDRKDLRRNPDLDVLRGRADFQELTRPGK
jgi:hypothetical protein